ncbi:MAG: TraR/DksA C4-type zinc finger protein [Phycisphaerales bacterium]
MAKTHKKAPEKKPSKPASKPAAKSASKPVAKPAAKGPVKSAAKPAPKSVAKPAPKPAAKAPAGKSAPAAKPAPAGKSAPAAKAPPAKSGAKPAAKPAPAPKAAAPAKPAPPLVLPKVVNSGPKEVIPAVAPKAVWRASNEAPPPKKKPGKGAPPPSIRDPRKEALEALRQQQLAAERAASKHQKKIDFSSVRSVASVARDMKPDSNGYVLVNGRRVRLIAGGTVKVKKKTKTVAEKPRDEGPTDEQIAAIKTRLTAKELNEYKAILLQARAELIARVTGLEDEALRSSGGNLSNMPLHMADIGTDTFDQDLAIGMAETERELLREIDDALDRVVNKTYGVCQLTGKPIPKARLEAKPWAKYTIEAARVIEKSGGR